MEESSWSSPLIVNITVPLDLDNDGIYDYEDSDDDNDGLSDKVEEQLCSNPLNPIDVIAIDIGDETHYLVDTDENVQSDIFYNTISTKSTSLKLEISNT